MSSIIKVFLLLAVMVCITKAQLNEAGQQCLCQRVRKALQRFPGVRNIQIYPETLFCDRVEIVVTANNGYRYCLDPKMDKVKKLMASIMNKNKTSTAAPRTEVTSISSSTDAARI